MLKTIALASLATALLGLFPSPSLAACGEASHYGKGDGFGGRRTASGSYMDPYGMTTAHPSLPHGSLLKVTNTSNGRSVLVTVNDRGPYYGSRILDLSYGAFSRISNPSRGTAYICYQKIA
jgi:rare lipoprotein A